MTDQIPLELASGPVNTLDNFYIGRSNQDAFAALQAFPNWPSPIFLLTGPQGSGKSHLGFAWASSVDDMVFWDDADKFDETDLFTVLNRALNGEIPGLLLTSENPPQRWDISLPDLRSRLINVPVLQLSEPDEDILEPIIRKLFEDKGRDVKADLVGYIYTHYERSVPLVSKLVHDIDLAARQAKRDVTRAFVVDYLKTVSTN